MSYWWARRIAYPELVIVRVNLETETVYEVAYDGAYALSEWVLIKAIATPIFEYVSVRIPKANQSVIATCMRHPTTFETAVQDYPGNRRFIECPTCGLRYFWTCRKIRAAEGMHEADYSYLAKDLQETPETGHWMADNKQLEIIGILKTETVPVRVD